MSDTAARVTQGDATPADGAPPGPRPAGRWRRVVRGVAVRVVFWYAVVVIVLGFFQRSLMYFPSRAERIDPAEAGLAAGRVHDVSFVTADGLTLAGWHVVAEGGSCATLEECDRTLRDGRLVVLHFHGNGGDRRIRVDDALIFGGSGADTILIDYRGYGENPGSPSEAGLADDARAAWNYATDVRGVRPDRIVLYGESLGGAVAVRLAAELCDAGTPPAGVAVLSTFSSMTDAAAHHYPWLPVRLVLLDRYPAIRHIGRVTCPLLFVHAGNDRIVPIELGRRLFAAAPERSAGGVEKRFVVLAGCDHNDVLFRARGAYTEAVGEFLGGL
ncbi:MAG TPA: alpha/beta hydrolase [Planctomycetaceae bacterium]|nr:alpha/beta hydrolase [Planctomycetaceae bacterium]